MASERSSGVHTGLQYVIFTFEWLENIIKRAQALVYSRRNPSFFYMVLNFSPPLKFKMGGKVKEQLVSRAPMHLDYTRIQTRIRELCVCVGGGGGCPYKAIARRYPKTPSSPPATKQTGRNLSIEARYATFIVYLDIVHISQSFNVIKLD